VNTGPRSTRSSRPASPQYCSNLHKHRSRTLLSTMRQDPRPRAWTEMRGTSCSAAQSQRNFSPRSRSEDRQATWKSAAHAAGRGRCPRRGRRTWPCDQQRRDDQRVRWHQAAPIRRTRRQEDRPLRRIRGVRMPRTDGYAKPWHTRPARPRRLTSASRWPAGARPWELVAPPAPPDAANSPDGGTPSTTTTACSSTWPTGGGPGSSSA